MRWLLSFSDCQDVGCWKEGLAVCPATLGSTNSFPLSATYLLSEYLADRIPYSRVLLHHRSTMQTAYQLPESSSPESLCNAEPSSYPAIIFVNSVKMHKPALPCPSLLISESEEDRVEEQEDDDSTNKSSCPENVEEWIWSDRWYLHVENFWENGWSSKEQAKRYSGERGINVTACDEGGCCIVDNVKLVQSLLVKPSYARMILHLFSELLHLCQDQKAPLFPLQRESWRTLLLSTARLVDLRARIANNVWWMQAVFTKSSLKLRLFFIPTIVPFAIQVCSICCSYCLLIDPFGSEIFIIFNEDTV